MFKKLNLLFTLFLFIVTVSAQTKDNDVYLFSYFKGNGEDGLHLAYSHDGLKWLALKNDSSFLKPAVSKDKLMRDPCIIRGADGYFHMVWTVSWNDKGIGYAKSKDLINWSEQKFIPVMANESGARNCWAPEITYDDKTETYMIYWATTITGKFPETASEAENSYNHRMYFTTTKDFENFADTKLLYDPGFNSIDATIIKRGKQFVMFIKDETVEPTQKNIKIAYSKKLTGPYTAAGPSITGNYWAEGPTTLQLNDQLIVYFDKYRDHTYGAITSSDFKTWVDISDKISMPKGIRHGSAFKVTREEFERLGEK